VSLSENEKTVFLKENNAAEYSHSEQLHVYIKDILEQASISFTDLDAVAVSMGPGSYTGLRIGVSAAKGLCFSLDIPLISVSTLQSMAMQMSVGEDEVIIPVLDARRMEVYSAVYDKQYGEIRETRAEIIDENSFAAFINKNQVHVIGNGASKCEDVIKYSNFLFDASIMPSAKEMGPIAYGKYQNQLFEDVAYFEPYYLKDFVLQGKKPNQ